MECGAGSEDNFSESEAETLKMSEQQADHLWDLRHGALYRCRLSSLYHRRRERFYDFLDKANNAVALIGGSAAFAAAADKNSVEITSFFVAISGAISLVFSFAEKARRHSGLAESYKRVESDILLVGEYDYTENQVFSWMSRIAEIEGTEPPSLRPLIVLCQNDIAIASNQLDKVVSLKACHRLLAQFFDFDVSYSASKVP